MDQRAQIWGPIAETETSVAHVLEPYAVDRMPLYDYVQEEYFVSGVAADAPYGTRILVRRPRNMANFSGQVVTEVSHIWGGTSVWRALNRQIMRSGHIWVEIDSQAPSALDLIQGSNPERYRHFTFVPGELASDFAASIPFTENPTPEILAQQYDEFKARWWLATPQSFEIIAQVANTLRQGLPGLAESHAQGIFFAGISQTGGVVRRFIELHHARLRRAGGLAVFDGYLPAASGGDALADIDVPVMEVLGEAEFQSVRWACGVSGQVRGLTHRRPDSPTFRLYEVAGMAHRETRELSDNDQLRLASSPLPDGATWSTFPNSFVYGALLEILIQWASGTQPPASRLLLTRGETDDIVRDEIGNARGGLRTTFTDAPTSALVAATPMGRPSWYHGNETSLDAAALRGLYGTPEDYQRAHSAVLTRLLDERFLLAPDAAELRRIAAAVTF